MTYIGARKPSGWLRFLIVMLMWLAPIFGFFRTFGEIGDTERLYPQLVGMGSWTGYKAAIWTGFALQAGLLFVAGYRLDKLPEPASPRLAVAMLWIAGPVLSTLTLVALGAISGADILAGNDGATAIGGLVISIFWATVWSLYLWRSAQVRAIYFGAVG